jgi:tRNA dimethylallyltransferase
MEEMDGVPHHMIDIADPESVFSVQQYAKLGTQVISDIISRSNTVIICGGSGMYIDSLISGTEFPNVSPNPKLRLELERKSTLELYSLLQSKDPRRAKTIDPDNPVRLVRALEVINALGVVPKVKRKSKYQTLYIGLDLPKEELNKHIKKRIIERFENQGMLDEAISLYTNGLSYKRMNSLGLEYRCMARHLQEKISYDEMVLELTTKTIQFAKRQRTWFKRNKKIHWFHSTIDVKEIDSLASKFLKK